MSQLHPGVITLVNLVSTIFVIYKRGIHVIVYKQLYWKGPQIKD